MATCFNADTSRNCGPATHKCSSCGRTYCDRCISVATTAAVATQSLGMTFLEKGLVVLKFAGGACPKDQTPTMTPLLS